MSQAFCPKAVAICVPVRNEAALLPNLLQALKDQDRRDGCDVTLCFWLDDCRDASAAIIEQAALHLPFKVLSAVATEHGSPNAGRARRAAMRIGMAAVAGHPHNVLLTTDADSVPARGWVVAACRALETCDVVAGWIIRDGGYPSPVQDRLEAYYERLYALRRRYDPVPWERPSAHHYTGGANLGFRSDAYHRLGGFAAQPSGEDAAIIDAAHRLGLRVRRDRDVTVQTSGRLHGRAIHGLADHLRDLSVDGTLPSVAHPDDAAWQYRGHALARATFPMMHDYRRAASLGKILTIDVDHVRRIAERASNAEAFATCVVPAAPDGPRTVSLAEAEIALGRLELADIERAA